MKIIHKIGGTKFTTTKTTLLKFKGSYFETLLESGSPHHNGDELEYFILFYFIYLKL